MTHKILIGLGVLIAAGASAGATANAAGAGASIRANMNIPVKSLAKTVAMSPRGIRRSLRARGYRKIHFTDRHLPVYKVRACRNGKKFRMRLNRWGDIRRRVRIGWCGGYDGPRIDKVSFPEIRRKLRHRGYYNVRFTDRRLPGYRARACSNGKRYVLWINRFGKIRDRERRGWCDYRSGRYDGPRRRPHILYDGHGVSITLGRGKHRY